MEIFVEKCTGTDNIFNFSASVKRGLGAQSIIGWDPYKIISTVSVKPLYTFLVPASLYALTL